MDWQKMTPGTWWAQVQRSEYWPAGVYVFTLVPSGRPRRGNLYYLPKTATGEPCRLGCEITFAHAKQVALQHDDTSRQVAEQFYTTESISDEEWEDYLRNELDLEKR